MKKQLGILLVLLNPIWTIAQFPDWNTAGNTSTNQTSDFVGTTDNQDLRFRTNNAFRMTLNGTNGRLGLNLTNPSALFHMDVRNILKHPN